VHPDDGSDSDDPGPPATEQEPEEPEFDPSGDEEESDLPQFPTTHEIILKDHSKVVSALALDPSGARILSGSHDYDCKLWDFGGMDYRCKPFKSWEPAGTYHVQSYPLVYCFVRADHTRQIHDLKYSNDGQKFLVVSGTTQAKLYDRDGEEECVLHVHSSFWIASPDGQGDLCQGRSLYSRHETHLVSHRPAHQLAC
jgi:WD40 repeat protein